MQLSTFATVSGLKQTLRLRASRSDFWPARTSAQAHGWGVVKSLELIGSGPVVLVHTQNLRFFYKEKPTCAFGECPLLMEVRTLRIRGLGSAFDPVRTFHGSKIFCPKRTCRLIRIESKAGARSSVPRSLWRRGFWQGHGPRRTPSPLAGPCTIRSGRHRLNRLEAPRFLLYCAFPDGEVDEVKAKELLELFEEFRTKTMQFCLISSLANKANATELESNLDFNAKSAWVLIRGHRHQVLEGEFFQFVLSPHDDALNKAYGVGPPQHPDSAELR